MAKKQPNKFEDTLSQLDTLITKIDDEAVSLDESLAAFEQGIKLTREAQRVLEEAEQRIRLLLEKDGKPAMEAFLDADEK
jgi:exodeoxyribonuclease VII small subunit